MFNVHWQYLFSKLVYLTFVDQKPYAHFAKSIYRYVCMYYVCSGILASYTINHSHLLCCYYHYTLAHNAKNNSIKKYAVHYKSLMIL